MNKTVIEVENTSLSFANGFLRDARLDLDDIKRKFFIIGFRLNEAQEFNYAQALGYADIYALAEEEFGFKKTTTKNLMAINREFCDHEATGSWRSYTKEIGKGWGKYSQSQLVEMLPLNGNQRRNIPADFKESELKIYKKILAGEVLTSELKEMGNPSVTEDPRKYVDMYKENLKKTSDVNDSEIPAGQLYIGSDESINEYHQSGAPLLSADEIEELKERRAAVSCQLTDREEKTDLSKFVLSKEEMAERSREYLNMKIVKREEPEKHLFKNKKEREDFIRDGQNYTVTVLDNEELGIKVRRLDLANGAKIYRTDWYSYNKFRDAMEKGYTLHLVDDSGRALPESGACYSDYSAKCYTLTGTATSFIIEYMTMYRGEI